MSGYPGQNGHAPVLTDGPQGTPGWSRAPGVDALGLVEGSGLREPSYLVQRGDGQMVHVSELLHLILRELDAGRPADEVADAVSTAYGRRLTVPGLLHVVENKLVPLGLVQSGDGTSTAAAQAPRADPLLSLRLRGVLLPARATRAVAGVFAPLFWPPVVIAALVGLAFVDGVLLRRGGLVNALDQVLATPAFLLALVLLLGLGGLIHEMGHAAACRYGGARPGNIGVGVYLVFPAFYTDVTDSYRLDRAGRLRTDLGGLYFNVWCLLAAGSAYLATGQGLLLLVVLLMHVEMVQQLLPTVRFDGYFVLADLAGVPDLFSRVRPVMAGLLPGRPTDPRVAELRPAARRLVTAWVLLVVPMLVFGMAWLIWSLPEIISRTWRAMTAQTHILEQAWSATNVVTVVLAALSMVLLAVPLAGLAMLLPRVALLPVVWVRGRRLRRVAAASGGAGAQGASGPPLDATSFSDELMLPRNRPAPRHGWRRGVYRVTRGRVNLGPGRAELREQAQYDRVRTDIVGSRRVVVMSRKGGVGKTTVTLALGSTFSQLRSDRVVAVDANPDAGNLGYRVDQRSAMTVTDVLQAAGDIDSYAQLRRFTAQSRESRLEVLASDDDARITQALDRNDYHRLIDLLDHYYNLILLDTGTGILDSANQGLIAEADQLVLVLRPGLDGGRAAALTLDWLTEHGYHELVARAVVVINATRRGVGVRLDRVEEHFARRCGRVCRVPWDPALETGGNTPLSSLRPATRRALLEVAAAVADNFPETGGKR